MLDRRQLGMQIRRRRLCHFIAASRRSLWITHNSEHIIEWQFTTGLSRLNQDASALVTRALRRPHGLPDTPCVNGLPRCFRELFTASNMDSVYHNSVRELPGRPYDTRDNLAPSRLVKRPYTGIAVATLGLIISCVLGGPLAKYLIEKYRLHPSSAHPVQIELAPEDDTAPIDKMGVMRAILVVNIAVILGYLVHDWISNAMTIKVPLFVPCLIMGMVLSNTVPKLFPRWPWPGRTASLDLISSYSLSVFLTMSLMSMQVWTLAKVAGPLLVIVGVQTLLAAIYTLLVVFPALAKDYQAAVLSAGFIGISLGSTPTAIAAMTAVTKRYGPSPDAFVILPLASALFVSLVNVAATTLFLSL